MPAEHSGRTADRGALLLDAGRPDDALTELYQAVAADPTDARAHCLIALAHTQLGAPDRALQAASDAVGLQPESDWAHRLVAISLLSLNKNRKARRAALEACRLAPGEAHCLTILARTLLACHDQAGALEAAEQAVALAPSDPDAHNELGLVFLAHRSLEDAEQQFLHVLALDASNALAMNNLAVAHLRMHRGADAAKEFERAAAMDPGLTIARANILKIGQAARLKGRLAVMLFVFAAAAFAVQPGGASIMVAVAIYLLYQRRDALARLDSPARALIQDDARARRLRPGRWDWRWVTRLRPWWWVLGREVGRQIPAALVLSLNVVVLALYGFAWAGGNRESAWGVAIALVPLPFTARRFHRGWRRKHSRRPPHSTDRLPSTEPDPHDPD